MQVHVRDGHFVRLECELRVSGGEVIESSKKTGLVEYKHGTGQLLPGLESRIEGMGVGEEKSGVIPAADAFGAEGGQATMSIRRSEFPKDAKVEKGARFEAKGPTGAPLTLEVAEIDADAISAKVVHPLAGKDLEYSVKVISVRPPPPPVPTVEEIDLVEDADAT